MRPKIAFYSDALTSGRYGLGRYAWELFRHLGSMHDQFEVRSVSAHRGTAEGGMAPSQRLSDHIQLPFGRKVTAALWSTVGGPPIERWVPWANLVHCVEPDYRVVTKKRLVVTIHDIGPLTHPEYFRANHPWLLKKALHSVAQRADAIICVSQATAGAVQEYLNCPLGDRLSVVWEGVSEEFFQPVPPGCLAPRGEFTKTPYFLSAGSLSPRKNITRVVRAFEQVAAELPHHLILMGGVGWDASETLRSIQESRYQHRIHLPGRVTDLELRSYYQHAAAFVYPSLMEGFGLPILEAMASDCPVITSNCSSMPEVAGDAALLVDPERTEEIAAALQRIATDCVLADRLVNARPDAGASVSLVDLCRSRR